MVKAKTIYTIGPALSSETVLRKMICAEEFGASPVSSDFSLILSRLIGMGGGIIVKGNKVQLNFY